MLRLRIAIVGKGRQQLGGAGEVLGLECRHAACEIHFVFVTVDCVIHYRNLQKKTHYIDPLFPYQITRDLFASHGIYPYFLYGIIPLGIYSGFLI